MPLYAPPNIPVRLPLQGGAVQAGYPRHPPSPRARGCHDPRTSQCLCCVFRHLQELDPG